MRFVKIPRADGTFAFINPHMVRAVVANDKFISIVQFDNDHVLMIREPVEKVAEQIEAAF
jgi:hypothetical protein